MKITQRGENLLTGTAAIISGLGFYGAWSNQQAAIKHQQQEAISKAAAAKAAIKRQAAISKTGARIGTYEATRSRLQEGKQVKVSRIVELKPNGQYTQRTYFGYKFPGRFPTYDRTYVSHPDGGFSFQTQKGTYILRDNEIDLMRSEFACSDCGGQKAIMVTTARFTEDGFTEFREGWKETSRGKSRDFPGSHFVKIK